jgi:hypothetical protein
MMEPAIAWRKRAQMIVNGLSVVYDYATPVSVGPSGEVTLPFDDLSSTVELENRAVPRHDTTAFLVAMGGNTTGETILPGHARFYRDGDLIGDSDFAAVDPAGRRGRDGLRTARPPALTGSTSRSTRATGASSSPKTNNAAGRLLGREHLGGTAETVRLLYATPFAEQEDIEVDVRSPVRRTRPTSTTCAASRPGTSTSHRATPSRIEMSVELTWPDEMMLNWRPDGASALHRLPQLLQTALVIRADEPVEHQADPAPDGVVAHVGIRAPRSREFRRPRAPEATRPLRRPCRRRPAMCGRLRSRSPR